MPRLRMDDDEFNVDELDEAEYDEENQFQPYTGPTPPNNTILPGRIKKAWWTFTQNDDRMMKVVFEADEYAGKYKDCPVWDNIVFSPSAKFRWKPFLDAFGLTLIDFKKRLSVIGGDDEDDPQLGAPIEKVGKWEPGEESADTRIIVISKPDNNRNMRLNVVKYLPYEDEDEDEDDDYDEDEEEEEQPPPRRSSRAPAAKSAGTSKAGAARRRPAPEPADDEDDEDQEEEAAPERPAKRRAAGKTATPAARPARSVPARSAAKSGRVATKPTRSRRAVIPGTDDDPPF
jgi:hypothetical protein